MAPVLQAYLKANGGQTPTDISQLLPYLETTEQQEAFQKLLRQYPGAK